MKYSLKSLKVYFLCPLFFLLGSIITLNVVHFDDDCIADKIDKSRTRYYRTANFQNPNLIILVISAPQNLDRRNIARETWLTLGNKNKNFMHYFVVGSLGLNTDMMLHLSSEQSKYNDLLILPIHDTYSKLTYKILQSFIWIEEQTTFGLNYSYILKTDDDSFVRLDLLQKEIESTQDRHKNKNFTPTELYQSLNIQRGDNSPKGMHVYWGYFYGNAKVKTQGKWKETNWVLCDNYIPYAQGGGYLLSQGLIQYIAKNANDLILYNSEDVSVGTWLAPLTNIIRIHDTRFDTEWTSRGCLNQHLVFHKIPSEEMRHMFININKHGLSCTRETLKRKEYMYDWSVQPSKCCVRTQ